MAKSAKGPDRSREEDLAVEHLFRSNVTNIVPVELEKEMQTSFIDYAMSVITDRALPDVRDGLKPVHRRILYSMFTQGFTPDKPYRKCATTVGDVLGRFHPHGDAAVYDSLVRLAQDFSMRHTLVDGHGNFGSRDGDPPAAYRYTEARLTRLAVAMMNDINKNTVDFQPNFDEHELEPTVLPSHYPNLLVNGSTGIAVGMATNIPPHNLGEVIDGAICLLQNPEADLDELMEHIPGPDFPTEGTILGTSGIREVYTTGRGRITVRATTEIEEDSGGRHRILVRDLPYMVNKARLIEKIAELVKDKKIEGISFVRDESDRNEAVRIVIEVKRDANVNVVLNQLFRMTQLQENFNANILALVPDDEGTLVPRIINLKEALAYSNTHQKMVILRRTQFDLDKAEARKHIVEGLRLAIDHIDEVIRIIRSSKVETEAKERLSERFGFSERQAQHIVDMRLGRLTGLERDKLANEYEELLAKIEEYIGILSDESKLIAVVVAEMEELKKRFTNPRRTTIDPFAEEITDESLIKEEPVVVTLTKLGYIKRQPLTTYSSQHRGGRGIIGLNMREDDLVKQIITTGTHDWLLFFTNTGRVFRKKAYQVPAESRQSRGIPVINLIRLAPEERVQTILSLRDGDERTDLLFATRRGQVKRTDRAEFANINRAGLIAISIRPEDQLVGVEPVRSNDEVMLISRQGMAIRFRVDDCRRMGRNAMGVKGVDLAPEDEVISLVAGSADAAAASLSADPAGKALTAEEEAVELLFVSCFGFGKKTPFDAFRLQKRAGKGLICYKPSEKTGELVAALPVGHHDDIMLINDKGVIIRIEAAEVSSYSRTAAGVKLMRAGESTIVDVTVIDHEDIVEEEEEPDAGRGEEPDSVEATTGLTTEAAETSN